MGNCSCIKRKQQQQEQKKDIQWKVDDKCLQKIDDLYEKSWRKRNVDEQYKQFVRDIQNKQELKKYYNLSLSSQAELQKVCNKFREVRGDGNCFYTAFGFQFLDLLLSIFDEKQFQDFIQKYDKIEMKIQVDDFQINDEYTEDNLRKEFFNRLQNLRNIQKENRKDQYIKQFKNYENKEDMDCYLYGLSTIFFRNLANKVVDENNMADLLFDRQNLLIWESECNNNEVVIAALAKSLQIKIVLIFFQNNGFEQKVYEEQYKNLVILLIKPGHYNIGLFSSENEY